MAWDEEPELEFITYEPGTEHLMFKLRRPCVNCPFRIGVGRTFQLAPERLREILNAPAFQCHKTVDYADDDPRPGEKPQQCAGLMAVLHRSGKPNQIMQVAERLDALDPTALDPDGEAYACIEDAVRAHVMGEEP
jgi:hypothetical protein